MNNLKTTTAILLLALSGFVMAATQTIKPDVAKFILPANSEFDFNLLYDVSDKTDTSGVNFSLYFDSSKLSSSTENISVFEYLSFNSGITDDSDNFDDNPATDKQIALIWSLLLQPTSSANLIKTPIIWPQVANYSLPLTVMTATFTTGAIFSGETEISLLQTTPTLDNTNISLRTTALGYTLETTAIIVTNTPEIISGNQQTATISASALAPFVLDYGKAGVFVTFTASEGSVFAVSGAKSETRSTNSNGIVISSALSVPPSLSPAKTVNITSTNFAAQIINYTAPLDSDNDNDQIGDNIDSDDDNDQLPDSFEIDNGLNPLDPSDAAADADNDGISNLDEYLAHTNLFGANVITFTSPDIFSIAENSKEIGVISASNLEGHTLDFSIGGADKDLFFISNENVLSFSNSPNFEAPQGGSADNSNQYEIIITAKDKQIPPVSANQNLFITVTDAADTPTISGIPPIASTGQNYIFTPISNDEDNNPLTYTFSGTLPAGLSFNSNNGEISGTPSVNYAVAEISITVSDTQGLSAILSITIIVTTGFSMDIDDDSTISPITDGVLIIRYMLNPNSNTLDTSAALGANAVRTATTILAYLRSSQDLLDIDDDDIVSATTDGILILRYMLDPATFTSTDAVGDNAGRDDAQILQHLQFIFLN